MKKTAFILPLLALVYFVLQFACRKTQREPQIGDTFEIEYTTQRGVVTADGVFIGKKESSYLMQVDTLTISIDSSSFQERFASKEKF